MEAPWRKLARYPARLYQAEHASADALALAQLRPLDGQALPWTTFSMRPMTISAAVTEVVLAGRRTVVECGSGNSTVYLARLFSQLGAGHVYSLEHDESWARLTSSFLEREGLSEWGSVVYAPLSDGWYDRSAIPSVESIDLLIVDGPPAHSEELAQARYPAWPHFASALAPGAVVLVDDVDRPGEQQVMARWASEFGAVARPEDTHETFALIRT